MLAEYQAFDNIITSTLEEASDALSFDVKKLITKDAHNQLNETAYTQVAMLAANIALYRILESLGKHKCALMAGHSLGEYAALVAANVLSF